MTASAEISLTRIRIKTHISGVQHERELLDLPQDVKLRVFEALKYGTAIQHERKVHAD